MDSRQDPLTPLPPIRDSIVYDNGNQHPPLPNPLLTPSSSTSNVSSATATSAGKKRRGSTTGSRCVAKLTPEQLAKKRANDREAQKAIRERTRNQIETLERRIRELTDQKPYQELQDVLRQKEAVEAENEDIKRRLTTVLSIVQPICRASGLSSASQSYLRDASLQTQGISPDANQARPPQPGTPSGPTFSDTASMRRASSVASTYNPSPQATRQVLPPTPAPYGPQTIGFPPVNTFDTPRASFASSSSSRPDEKLELGYLLQSRQNSTASSQPTIPERTPSISSLSNHPLQAPLHALPSDSVGPEDCRPAHAVGPKNLNVCPLDGLLMKFLADQRQRARDGVPMQELIGPAYPSFRSLLDPRASEYSHPLSKVFTEMLGKFPDISTLPEQVAILYVMFLIMRWQIWPSQETYDDLPEWVTPRPAQLFTPHPAWIDHIPWPRMRDRMVRLYPSIMFEDFFIPYTTTVSLNWPDDDKEVLEPMPDTEELCITPKFERHLRDLNSWSLGPAFAKAHPVLADTFRCVPPNVP